MTSFCDLAGFSRPFPTKEHQGVVPEAPISSDATDCLEFGDYADVLVERITDPAAWPVGVGVYAQWGAGKVSACARSPAQHGTLQKPAGLCAPAGGQLHRAKTSVVQSFLFSPVKESTTSV